MMAESKPEPTPEPLSPAEERFLDFFAELVARDWLARQRGEPPEEVLDEFP
jgi:hypothetical protein